MPRKKIAPQDAAPRIVSMPLAKLTTHPSNPRRGDVEAIRASIRANGFYGVVVAQASTMHIIAGNHRFLAAQAESLDSIMVHLVDVDDVRARAIMAADNRTSDLGGYDDERLLALLEELRGHDALEGTGYDDQDLELLLGKLNHEWSDEELEGAEVLTPDDTMIRIVAFVEGEGDKEELQQRIASALDDRVVIFK